LASSVQVVSLSAPPVSSTHTVRRPGSRRLLAAEAAATEATLSVHFDAFLKPLISPTPFPAWLSRQLRRAPGSVILDPALAVYLAPLADDWGSWVIRGAAGVCVEAINDRRGQARGDCGTITTAEHGGLVARHPGPDGRTRLLGLVPDTVARIGLRAGNETERVVSVTNNVWTSTVTGDTSSIAVLAIASATASYTAAL
jgi:hypothetical protein